MNQFITYQFVSETVKDMHTGYWLVDTLIKASLPIYLLLSNDLRYWNYCKANLHKLTGITSNCFGFNLIELKLPSNHATNYNGGYSSCSEDMKAIIYDINDLIYLKSKSIEKNAINKYEEIIINEQDGFGDNINLIVPIGSISLNILTVKITVKINIITESYEHKNEGRKDFRRVTIYLYSDDNNNNVNYIAKVKEQFSKNSNKETNKYIKWFRLRVLKNNNDDDPPFRFLCNPIERKSTFDNIFFKDKKKFIEKVDDFFKGKTTKLNLLLYGRPGGGKDELIVAITRYLSELSKNNPIDGNYDLYHIVSTSINLLNNDDDFMKFMYGNNTIDGKIIEHNRRVKVFPEIEKYLPQVFLKDELNEISKNSKTPDELQKKMIEIINNKDITENNDFKNIDFNEILKAGSQNKQKLQKGTILEALSSYMDQKGTICIFTTNLPLNVIDPVLIRDGRLEPFELGSSSLELTKEFFESRYSKDIIDKQLGVNGDFGINHEKFMPSTIVKHLDECSSLEETIEKLQNL